jgi:hypothetical protein
MVIANRTKAIIMLKAIMMGLNFNENTPIMNLSCSLLYKMNHKLKAGLRQRYGSIHSEVE